VIVVLGFRCRIEDVGDRRTITVCGALSRRTRGRLMEKMHELATRSRAPITVDVSALSYFDSASLTMLLGTERVLERQFGCPVDIRGIDAATFRLAGLEDLGLASHAA
jgi:anti-anti-sigma regulatory factor